VLLEPPFRGPVVRRNEVLVTVALRGARVVSKRCCRGSGGEDRGREGGREDECGAALGHVSGSERAVCPAQYEFKQKYPAPNAAVNPVKPTHLSYGRLGEQQNPDGRGERQAELDRRYGHGEQGTRADLAAKIGTALKEEQRPSPAASA
jgi:hypothetical protein